MIVLSVTEPVTAFVGEPREITTVSEDSASESSLTVMVTIPLVPSVIVTVSLTEKSPELAAEATFTNLYCHTNVSK